MEPINVENFRPSMYISTKNIYSINIHDICYIDRDAFTFLYLHLPRTVGLWNQ